MGTIFGIALSLGLIAFAGTETTDTGTDDSDCGDNCGTPEPPVILAPVDGAMVESPFLVEVDPGNDCWCDDCGCSPVEYDDIRIIANGQIANGGNQQGESFEIDLAPGVYELVAEGHWEFGLMGESEPITITVIAGDPPATESGTESGDDESGGSESGDSESGDSESSDTESSDTESGDGESGGNLSATDDDTTGDSGAGTDADAGCSCSTADEAPALAGLALLGLLALRRRRGD